MTRLSIGGKSRNGVNLSQARSQVAAVSGYLTPRSEAEKSVRACQAASSLGAVQVGLEGGGDLFAVPVGDEPHPGARIRWTTQVWTVVWGQVVSIASGRPVSPSHSPARFAPVREVPPLRSARRSRLCCAGSAHTSRPSRRRLPRPGPRSLRHVPGSRPCPAPTAIWAEREATRWTGADHRPGSRLW